MTYTCWQCRQEFEREQGEWFCPACAENREPIEVASPQFKGSGFYTTDRKGK